jgi:hypothetical protein
MQTTTVHSVTYSHPVGVAAARDSSRFAISAVLAHPNAAAPERGHVVATDGKVLALARALVDLPAPMLVPPSSLSHAPTKKQPTQRLSVDPNGGTAIDARSKLHHLPEQGRNFPPFADLFKVNGDYLRVTLNAELLATLASALSDTTSGESIRATLCIPINPTRSDIAAGRAIIVATDSADSVGLLMPMDTETDKRSANDTAAALVARAGAIIRGEPMPAK